jgi:hypothetical protein
MRLHVLLDLLIRAGFSNSTAIFITQVMSEGLCISMERLR